MEDLLGARAGCVRRSRHSETGGAPMPGGPAHTSRCPAARPVLNRTEEDETP